jgi:hypothetical protein
MTTEAGAHDAVDESGAEGVDVVFPPLCGSIVAQ